MDAKRRLDEGWKQKRGVSCLDALEESKSRPQDVARKVAGMINDRLPDITVEHVGSTAVSLGRYQLDAASFNMLTPSTHSGEACHGDLPAAPSEYTLELAMGAG